MFPFKKKLPAAPEVIAPKEPDRCEEVRRRLDETDNRLDKAIKEMNRRIRERQGLVVVK